MTLDNLQYALYLNNRIILDRIKNLKNAIDNIINTDIDELKKLIEDINDTDLANINQLITDLDTDLSNHTSDTVIHVTQDDKDLWNATLQNAKDYAKKLFDSVTSFTIEIVDTLPTENIKSMTIYFIRNGRDNESDYYEEYMYVNNKWEIIGSTFVNLAPYLLKADFEKYQQEIADKFTKYNTSDEIVNILKDYLLTQTFNDTIKNYVTTQTFDDAIKNYTTTEALQKLLEEYAKTEDIHTHENKDIIDKLSESADGNLLFNGQEIKGGSGSDITISEEDNNAIQQKDDGIFVEDKTEQINNIQLKLDNINISQSNTKEKAFEEDILWEGSCTNESINLSKSYQDYDELVFYLEYYDANRFRPLYRIISPTLINKIRNSSISNATVSMVWGHSNFNDYCDIRKTSTDTRLDISTNYMTLVKIIGRKYNQIVIDPVEHINTSQGIEDTPVGHIISHMGNTAPKHYLICDGTEYNISDYPYLAQHFKTEFGTYNYFGGDGINTFAVPDLRGEFLRGAGENGHINSGNGANIGEHQTGTSLPSGYMTSDNGNLYLPNGNNAHIIKNYDFDISNGKHNTTSVFFYSNIENVSYNGQCGEFISRPTNTSVLYCIKYEPTYYMTVGEYTVQGFKDYSEEEKIIGRWIDGRPIYRKVIKTSSSTKRTEYKPRTTFIFDSLLTDVDNVINYNGQWTVISGAYYVGETFYFNDVNASPNMGVNYGQSLSISANNCNFAINIASGWGITNINAIFIVEYTKSTDKENSFTPDMLSTIVMSGNKQEDLTEEELNNLITDTINLLNE